MRRIVSVSTRSAAALFLAVLLIPVACNQPAAEQTEDQTSGEPQFISADELEEAVAVDASEEVPPLMAETLSDYGHYRYLVVRRQASGEPGVHAEWADVMVVREGGGTLVYGGRVEGREETEPGEVRGGRIVDGQEQRLAAGDVVVLPARVPHQIQLSEGESIVYTVVKVKQPEANE